MNKHAVGILRNKEGELLLLRRSWSAPWMDYKYCLPGGTIEKDEKPIETLVRELNEEIGIEFKKNECRELLTLTEYYEGKKHTTHYFVVNTDNFNEEDIVLNYEHDKYKFIDCEDYDGDELIPNLDIVIESINEKQQESKDDILKGFFNELIENPFLKAELNRGKLTLKDVVDKLGRRTKRWVRISKPEPEQKEQKEEEQPEIREKKQPEEDKEKTTKKEHYDYHSVYKNEEKLISHAKEASDEDLVNFIENEKDNPNASKLLEIAQKELKERGVDLPDDSESPFKRKETAEKQDDKGSQTKEDSKLSENAKEHIEIVAIADNEKEVLNYLPEIENDETLSTSEKEEVKNKVYEHIGRLIAKKPIKEEQSLEPEKEESKSKPKSTKSDDSKKEPEERVEKHEDGTYDEITGRGWEGDESLGTRAKKEAERVDRMIKDDINSLTHPTSRVGELIMQTGPGGLGKTFTAVKTLKDEGYEEIEIGDKNKKGDKSKKGFVHVKGGMTAPSLFEAMHDYPYAVFLIDDAENIFNNPQALEYIKAATDTSKQTVTRALAGDPSAKAETKRESLNEQISNMKRDLEDIDDEIEDLEAERDPLNDKKVKRLQKRKRDVTTRLNDKQREIESLGEIRKKQFDFKGKVMMISNAFPTHNKSLWEKMYKPLMSRTTSGRINDLKMSTDSKLYKLSTLIPYFSAGVDSEGREIKPENFKERKEIYDFVKKLVQDGRIDDVSTRMLSGIYSQKTKLGENWKTELLKKYKKSDEDFEKSIDDDIFTHFENLILGFEQDS